MLHHRDSRFVEISDDSQSMTPILNIRGRRPVLSPLDPLDTPNPTLGMVGLVQSGLLVWVRPIPQPTILPANRPVNLRILEHPSPEFQSQNLRKILFESSPIDPPNLLLTHRASSAK